VQVSVSGHNSNVARVTEWQGQFTFKVTQTGGSTDTLFQTLTLNPVFREDIRE
jgi:hypothetical protein